jgi:hypothetical protein
MYRRITAEVTAEGVVSIRLAGESSSCVSVILWYTWCTRVREVDVINRDVECQLFDLLSLLQSQHILNQCEVYLAC